MAEHTVNDILQKLEKIEEFPADLDYLTRHDISIHLENTIAKINRSVPDSEEFAGLAQEIHDDLTFLTNQLVHIEQIEKAEVSENVTDTGQLTEVEYLERQVRQTKIRLVRMKKKAAKANDELVQLRQEVNRLKLENKIQLGWLNAEESYTRRYNALEARFNIIRDVLSDQFPEKYGEPGAYNWFGTQT